jgi:hypothetical protein
VSEIIKLLEYAKTIDNPVLLFGICAIIGFLLWQRFTNSEYEKGKKNYQELESMNRLQLDDNTRLRSELEKTRLELDQARKIINDQARQIEELHEHKTD